MPDEPKSTTSDFPPFAFLGAMPVEPCNFVGRCMASPASYANDLSGYVEKTAIRIANLADQKLAAAWQKTQEVHAANAAALAHNKELAGFLTGIMKKAGIPDTFSEIDKKSRSRYVKRVTLPAGYIADIRRVVVTDDSFSYAEIQYNGLARTYAEYRAKAAGEDERAKAAAQADKQAELDKRRADIKLATIILRYQMPEDSDWDAVLELLRGKDQYLDLAVAGMQTRLDWSEGFYRVESALGRFKINDDRDKDIAADICGCLSGDQDDGRTFRDTRWSYDKLFEIVADKQILEDANMALSNLSSRS